MTTKITQTQIRYALKRIGEMEQDKLREARELYTTDGVTLSGLEIEQALRNGEFKIKKQSGNNRYSIRDYVTFPVERKSFFDGEKYIRLEKKIKTEATRIRDQLMLGTNEEAAKALEEFAKF